MSASDYKFIHSVILPRKPRRAELANRELNKGAKCAWNREGEKCGLCVADLSLLLKRTYRLRTKLMCFVKRVEEIKLLPCEGIEHSPVRGLNTPL